MSSEIRVQFQFLHPQLDRQQSVWYWNTRCETCCARQRTDGQTILSSLDKEQIETYQDGFCLAVARRMLQKSIWEIMYPSVFISHKLFCSSSVFVLL